MIVLRKGVTGCCCFQGTLPVLIKQILNQKDDVVNMWGLEYKLINTIAVVRNIEHSSTKVTYSLEDLTGALISSPLKHFF